MLPDRFHSLIDKDLAECDLLMVLGTSLQVQPVASLIHRVNDSTPKLIINKENVMRNFRGKLYSWVKINVVGKGLGTNASYLGDCDEGILKLSTQLGWKDELLNVMSSNKIL